MLTGIFSLLPSEHVFILYIFGPLKRQWRIGIHAVNQQTKMVSYQLSTFLAVFPFHKKPCQDQSVI